MYRKREWETEAETDRQEDRQTVRHTDMQTDKDRCEGGGRQRERPEGEIYTQRDSHRKQLTEKWGQNRKRQVEG